jgi:O-acetylhomoserine (thiol)-lyase
MTLGFNTLAIHAGAEPDPATGARQVPIYQTTAYVFRDADHAAKLFNLQEVGYIYSRLTNPTVAALANRVAALEGGAGAVCCSSGHAAQIMALFPLMQPGTNVVASNKLYGGTIQQFNNTIRKFGWSAKLIPRRLPLPSTTTPALCSARPFATPVALCQTLMPSPAWPTTTGCR